MIKFTGEGIRGVKEAAERRQHARDNIERLGGRVIGNWATQGRYDVVWIADFPDETSASAFALGTGVAGRLTTETLRAFTPEEMGRHPGEGARLASASYHWVYSLSPGQLACTRAIAS